ncbi:hypothetical protein, partial [Escherichia coli]|uniref:hypothetical protein n=1 Tax=Escherichia coli TaxID=562 RepID=UPI001F4BA75D
NTTVDSIRTALQAYLFLIFIKMLRQLMFLLPIKFQRGKKLRTRRYRGLQSKEKRKLSLLTATFRDEVVGG